METGVPTIVLSSLTAFVLRGGIICGGRVASPANVFHQLQLYRTLSIGVEMRVVKSPSSSFIHIRETERERRGLLIYSGSGVWERCVCLFVFMCVSVRQRAQSMKFFPHVPLWGWMAPLWKVWTPDWEIEPSQCNIAIEIQKKYEAPVQRLLCGRMGSYLFNKKKWRIKYFFYLSRLVHSGPEWSTSTITGWIAVKFRTGVHPQDESNNLCDPLTFHLVLLLCWNYNVAKTFSWFSCTITELQLYLNTLISFTL